MKRLRVLLVVGVVVVFGPLAFLVWPPAIPSTSTWDLRLEEVRALARGGTGERPVQLRSRLVARSGAPRMLVVPDVTLAHCTFFHFTYQIVFPTRTIMVDAVNDATLLDRGFPGGVVLQDGYDAMQAALQRADMIVTTHEHFDHAGGIAHAPFFAQLAPHTHFTTEQLHSRQMVEAGFTPEQLQTLQPLDYQRLHRLAPGVVLIKAPGHTPGSQMVYLELSDGEEFILVGDVAWQVDNVSLPRMHARAVSWVAGEDVPAMVSQLAWLHALMESDPKVHLVVAHDGAQMDQLIQQGYVQHGLAPST